VLHKLYRKNTKSKIKLFYFQHPKDYPDNYNFGDALSPIIVSKVLDRKVEFANIKNADLVSIGSVMNALNRRGKNKVLIWGTGHMFENDKPDIKNTDSILALRGQLTADKYSLSDIALGDPALLSSRFIKGAKKKKYKLGIVPHFVDKESGYLANFTKNPDALIIDVFNSPQKACKQISSCENVISSSLHGIIVAHSYSIPAAWIELSNNVAGSGFKFRDYYTIYSKSPDKISGNVTDINAIVDGCWSPSADTVSKVCNDLASSLKSIEDKI